MATNDEPTGGRSSSSRVAAAAADNRQGRSLTDECLLSTGFFVSIFGLMATGFKFIYLTAVCMASSSRCECPWQDVLVYGIPTLVFTVIVYRKTPSRWRQLCGRTDDDDADIDMASSSSHHNNNNNNVDAAPVGARRDVEGGIEMHTRTGNVDVTEPTADDVTEADERRLARNNNETFMLAAVSVAYLLLTLVVVPSPNTFISLLVIFFGLVAWFLAYVWVMDVMMFTTSSSGPWLSIFVVTTLFVANTSVPPSKYPPCMGGGINGNPYQSLEHQVIDMPWNCVDPYITPVVNPMLPNITFEYRDNAGNGEWWVVGTLPLTLGQRVDKGAIIDPAVEFYGNLYCCGRQPELTQVLLFWVSGDPKPNTTVAEFMADEFCQEVPSFSHFPEDDISIMLFWVGWCLLAGGWAVRKILTWLRQRGMCLCLFCARCRGQYHGLHQQPENAF